MNKHKVILASILTASVFQVQAAANDSGIYVTVSAGQTFAKFNSSDFSTDSTGVVLSEKKDSTGFKLGGGYKFNKFLAVEGGYVDLGEFKYSDGPAPAYANGIIRGASQTTKNSVTGFALALVGSVPVGSFSFFGKVGVAQLETKSEWDLSVPAASAFSSTASNSKSQANVYFGAGAKYSFTDSLALRVEYEDFGKVGSELTYSATTGKPTGTGRMNVSLISLGLDYKF